MLKLYLYSYMNRIRSGRRLEQECQRNIELIWLLGGLCPGYHSITNSCRDNRKTVEKQGRTTFSSFARSRYPLFPGRTGKTWSVPVFRFSRLPDRDFHPLRGTELCSAQQRFADPAPAWLPAP
ncbi:MAG: transposase [Thiohalocapsa sp. PB-PSB1]|jgi:hypothetical protein|nr:MAG: transposase [Thiohalocapsa sp. PB-PSB1]HCS91574.1 hypothetical protein [Chromatiaceae bacterium]